jgi:hypothetical protein
LLPAAFTLVQVTRLLELYVAVGAGVEEQGVVEMDCARRLPKES